MTAQQSKVLDFIARFIIRYQHSPSFEEIAAGCGYTSLATIHKHVLALEAQGRIKRRMNGTRSIEVIEEPCAYRPIEEMHEDDGECVVIDILDPGHIETAHVCDHSPVPFHEVLRWATHFAPVPKLTHAQAEKLIREMKVRKANAGDNGEVAVG